MQISDLTDKFIREVREYYGNEFIPLHRPIFDEIEKQYLFDCIDSNFVSSAGKEVDSFEMQLCDITSSKYAKSTVSGTAALHLALHALGVGSNDEVLTQRLSFVATANAISYCNAAPIFLDVEPETGTLCPHLLRDFLEKNTKIDNGGRKNLSTGKNIAACVVMHTFGHPARMQEIKSICDEFTIPLIEDAAEALGSYIGEEHVGKNSLLTTYSFNGNKIITTGGGGCVTTDDSLLAERIRHLATTAKTPHQYEYFHDEIGFNYRMPNLNACLGLAQLKKLDYFLNNKRKLALIYKNLFENSGAHFWTEREGCKSNYWLNAISFNTSEQKQYFLEKTNKKGVMTRPVWTLLDKLPHFAYCHVLKTGVAEKIYDTTVNIPSSAI